MLYLVLIFVSALLLIYQYWLRNNDYWKKRHLVQENGVMRRFLTQKCSLAEVFKAIYDKYPNENYIGIFLSQPALLVRDVQDIQAVLQGDFQSFYSRGISLNPEDTLADNVLFMDDYKRWRLLRHKMSPVFTSRKLKNMFYIMDKCARDFIEIDNILQHIEQDTFKALSALTTSFIAATTFGVQSITKDALNSPFIDMVHDTAQPSLLVNLKFAIFSLSPFWFKTLKLKLFGKYEKFFIGTFKRVLEDRRRDKELRHDFVDTCIELQKNGTMQDGGTGYETEPTDEVLAAQAFFFFLAGIDTSATTIHFTLLELAANPTVLGNVHKEIDEVFIKCGDSLTFEAIENMQYLDMVINEAMRKYPPIGFIQRLCTNKTVLPAGNLEIDEGTVIIIPTFALQRDERYYTNPDLFNPERFSPENVQNIKKFTYLPFGEGNRICLGARLARLEVKSGIAWLLRKHTLKEQQYSPKIFDNISFAIKDSQARVKLMSRHFT